MLTRTPVQDMTTDPAANDRRLRHHQRGNIVRVWLRAHRFRRVITRAALIVRMHGGWKVASQIQSKDAGRSECSSGLDIGPDTHLRMASIRQATSPTPPPMTPSRAAAYRTSGAPKARTHPLYPTAPILLQPNEHCVAKVDISYAVFSFISSQLGTIGNFHFATAMSLSKMKQPPTEEELSEEALKLWLEEEDSLAHQVDALIKEALEDFPEEDDLDEAAKYAAEIARAVITDKTRYGHLRIVKVYIAFHMRKDPDWDANKVSASTPGHITQFIIHKCGDKARGGEGKKYATAVSTRAALTFWYRSIRPNESVSEWRMDSKTGECFGLPTRSWQVGEFMTGLEKTKAKAGEVSTSARALSLSDMHNLYNHCFRPNATPAEMRRGITAYPFAWLLLLRFEEVIRLQFESINIIPGARERFEVQLSTRKSAQTGVGHAWTLYANDEDPKICLMRALIRLSVVYGEAVDLTGPLFLKVNKNGAILQDPIVCNFISLLNPGTKLR
ncbi:hypothetical protein C8R43DRAFT_1166537 [Mycena crocata]|nr:hypothetical protein C8R43DRAFT_1166537 [Mycena crocata]